MNLVVSNDLLIGLSREATARSTSIDELAETLLRSIIQDRLFDAVIDDENKLPRRHRARASGMRVTHQERRARILQLIDESEGGEITVQKLGGSYTHLWTKPLKSLVRDGTVRVEHRYGAGNYRRAHYSRIK